MTKEQVIAMAREAGFATGTRDYASGVDGMPFAMPVGNSGLVELERFAKLVRNAALEEVATKAMNIEGVGHGLEIADYLRAMKETI